MRIVYIIIFVVLALLLLFVSRKEGYLSTTYVMTPRQTGVYPTAVTDFYWWDRYIRQPYVRYSALPYGGYGWGYGAYPGPRRRRRHRYRRHW